VDLVVITDEPDVYLNEPTWAYAFGTVVSHQIEHDGKVTSLRVRYEDQLEIEYGRSNSPV